MNKEIIKEWLNDIATPTGISYSGDQTISESMVEKIVDYVDELEQQENKQLKEVIDKIMNLIKKYGKYDGEKCTQGFQMWTADFNKILDILKEVSK